MMLEVPSSPNHSVKCNSKCGTGVSTIMSGEERRQYTYRWYDPLDGDSSQGNSSPREADKDTCCFQQEGRILMQTEKGTGTLWKHHKEKNALCSRTQLPAEKYLPTFCMHVLLCPAEHTTSQNSVPAAARHWEPALMETARNDLQKSSSESSC